MALEPLSLPPGVRHNGTALDNKGRWYKTNLVRFYQGETFPHGGTQVKSTSSMTGKGRRIISWHDNSQNTWSAIGTESHLYAMTRSGSVSDITPTGFTAGNADASTAGGYGTSIYGTGYPYGAPTPDTNSVTEADVWSLDNFGQYLNGVMPSSGIIYQWTLNTGVVAAAVSGAPSAKSCFTTAEGMLMALAAANNPRLAQWSDQQNNTTWTPTTSNQAGDFQLGTNGQLLAGLRIKGASLIGSDIDVWLCTYQANTFVYSFNKVGSEGCGFISRNCAIAVDAVAAAYGAQAVWMGQNGFYLFNGYVSPIQCDVWDYVFSNMNKIQKSKVTVEMNSDYGEITWKYPSGSSTEIDSYVTWNFRENHWAVGSTTRLSGVVGGVNANYPLRVGVDGNVYAHEIGTMYEGGMMPFLESGPLEIGNGDAFQQVNQLLPDEQIVGNCTVTFFTKTAPGNAEVTVGPFTLSAYTGTYGVNARQIRVRFDATNNNFWRLGLNKMDIEQGDSR